MHVLEVQGQPVIGSIRRRRRKAEAAMFWMKMLWPCRVGGQWCAADIRQDKALQAWLGTGPRLAILMRRQEGTALLCHQGELDINATSCKAGLAAVALAVFQRHSNTFLAHTTVPTP